MKRVNIPSDMSSIEDEGKPYVQNKYREASESPHKVCKASSPISTTPQSLLDNAFVDV